MVLLLFLPARPYWESLVNDGTALVVFGTVTAAVMIPIQRPPDDPPLARKRATAVRLRDENQIDDTVPRQIQARLDIEEVRLSDRELVDRGCGCGSGARAARLPFMGSGLGGLPAVGRWGASTAALDVDEGWDRVFCLPCMGLPVVVVRAPAPRGRRSRADRHLCRAASR